MNGLLTKRHSRGALRLAQERVLRARAERASTFADRAAVTLAAVLRRLDQLGSSSVPESLVRV